MQTEIPDAPAVEVLTIHTQTNKVLKARAAVESTAGVLKAKREAFDRDNADLFRILDEAKAAQAEAESLLRQMAIDVFNATTEKKPGPGVSVIEETVLEYADIEALGWAAESGLALMLDRKRFEDIAKVNPLPFVTIKTQPKAKIATDLAKALQDGAA